MNSITITIKDGKGFKATRFEKNDTLNIKKDNFSCQTIDDCPVSKHNVVLDNFECAIVNKAEESGYNKIWIDDSNSLSIAKDKHSQIRKLYSKLKKPVLYSPYHILLYIAKSHSNKSGLFSLIYNEWLYCIAVDKYNKIIFYDNLSLESTGIVEIPVDEKIAQKLEDSIENFYNQSNSFFIEYIKIYNNGSIDNTINTLMIENKLKIDSKLSSVDIHQTIYNILNKDIININSVAKNDFSKLKTIIFSGLLIYGLYYAYQHNYHKKINLSIFSEIDTNKLKNISLGSFQNIKIDSIKDYFASIDSFDDIYKVIFDTKIDQKQYNENIKNRLKLHFDMIPNDIYLDKFYLYQNSAKLHTTLVYKESYSLTLKDKLKIYYNQVYTSKTGKKQQNFTATVICKQKKAKSYYTDNKYSKNTKKILANIFPFGTQIKVKQKNKKYFVKTYVQTIPELYNMIDNLGKKMFNIQYPIIFKKQEKNIQVKFFVES